jgi:manganese/zinc/iron transport system permease protein
MTLLSGFFGGLSGYLGSSASSLLPRLPTGSVIVLTGGVLFTFSLLFAPARGIAANVFRLARLRLKISRDHLLRGMYEILEDRLKDEKREPPLLAEKEATIPIRELSTVWGLSRWTRTILIQILSFKGLLRQSGQTLKLSPQGMKEASLLTRNHRLWEEFLVTYTHLVASHVDRSADRVEHVLSSEMVLELEDALRIKGQLPDPQKMMPSIHPLAET